MPSFPDKTPLEARATIEAVTSIVHVLLNNRSSAAIRESLVFLSMIFGIPKAAMLLFLAGGGGMAEDNEGRSASLSAEERAGLEAVINDPVWQAGERKLRLPFPGDADPFAAVAEMRTRGTGVGYLVLARPSSPFSEGERIKLASIAEILAPVLDSRFGRSAEESKRREAERELEENERIIRSFIRNSPDMVYRCDAEDRFLSINAAGLALLGIEDARDCLGKRYSEFVLNESDRAAILERIANQGSVRDFEIVFKRGNGERPFCIESSQPYYGSDGAFAGVHGIVKDISGRVENDRKLWMLTMEITEANRRLEETRDLVVRQEKLASIGQLAAGVAHEINNPLSFIKSNSEMSASYARTLLQAWHELSAALPGESERVSRKLDLPFAVENLERMERETRDGIDRIVKIVSGLKTFARKDSGAGKAPYDLNNGVRSTLAVATNEIKYVADVELRLGDAPPVLANGNEIDQVILNILVNAAQAIAAQKRPDKGKITVSTGPGEGGAICSIADDGPGMPPEVKARVFEPFFTTKEAGKGTGLGLSISNEIVVGKHGGILSVESEPGKGTVFTIYLPAKPGAGIKADPAAGL